MVELAKWFPASGSMQKLNNCCQCGPFLQPELLQYSTRGDFTIDTKYDTISISKVCKHLVVTISTHIQVDKLNIATVALTSNGSLSHNVQSLYMVGMSQSCIQFWWQCVLMINTLQNYYISIACITLPSPPMHVYIVQATVYNLRKYHKCLCCIWITSKECIAHSSAIATMWVLPECKLYTAYC